MTNDEFIAGAIRLCGEYGWKTALGKRLGVRAETVARWAKGINRPLVVDEWMACVLKEEGK